MTAGTGGSHGSFPWAVGLPIDGAGRQMRGTGHGTGPCPVPSVPVYLLTPAWAATSTSTTTPRAGSLAATSISMRAWGPTLPLA